MLIPNLFRIRNVRCERGSVVFLNLSPPQPQMLSHSDSHFIFSLATTSWSIASFDSVYDYAKFSSKDQLIINDERKQNKWIDWIHLALNWCVCECNARRGMGCKSVGVVCLGPRNGWNSNISTAGAWRCPSLIFFPSMDVKID